ncbi:MAG: transcription-repair coupling factor [Vulcanibacillus sp.]
MDIILEKFSSSKEYQAIITGLKEGLTEQLVTGLSGSTKNILLAALYKEEKRPVIIITHNLLQAQKVFEDLNELVEIDQIFIYPDNKLTVYDIDAQSPEILGQRIKVLKNLVTNKKGIYIIPYVSFQKFLSPKEDFESAIITLKVGQEIELDKLIKHLVFVGYERLDMVSKHGEFSVRGGVIDIFSLASEHPVRIEFFDINIDSIRTFDAASQRSVANIEAIDISPVKDFILTKEQFQQVTIKVEEILKQEKNKLIDPKLREKKLSNLAWEIEQLKQGKYFSGITKYVSLLYSKKTTILDYLSKNSIIIFDEPSRIYESSKQIENELNESKIELIEQGEYILQDEGNYSYPDLVLSLNKQVIYLSIFLRQSPNTSPQNIINFICHSMQNFYGQLNVVKSELDRWRKAKNLVVFLAADLERAKRLQRVLADFDIEVDVLSGNINNLALKPVIMIGNLMSGFEIPSINIVVITEGEIYSNRQRRVRKAEHQTNAERIKSYTDLNIGDYVVHINHGIGIYTGIETLKINDIHKDYLHIKYANNDKLFVPIEQINLVQKYIGGEGQSPKVYSLGGNEWSKIKNKVKSSVKDIAQELIVLYAKRQAIKGYAFPKDQDYHREFASMFPYEETPDQSKTIEEISRDMEKERPMDRLLCGDVGYGKTEVAVRAAFKAAFAGKQVAILVPTTILAQQHFKTFKERFMDYPIKIGVISRFVNKKEQSNVINQLKNGTIDIVIGTHRMLSKDIVFSDLGLLIIDEEQRFGVKHKEKIKELKTNVDVLTLTATPIPRTLHMSILGVRDLSIIETPPENRFPVQTYVLEYSDEMIREAIEREIARGGQVYFLYNRVKTIFHMADLVRTLVPSAKVAVAHGQLPEAELESVMYDFLEGEQDVLVSTTIIEAGVDIPNVNTLIVCDAERMGLSQLYQLRGRVGRSNRIAYSYFTYQRDKVLSEVAEKRLQAIKEFTELGSGFKIAMRDLAIRGAGNLLGAEQHGFITSIGFDLYNQMLKEAIDELKGDVKEEVKFESQIELDIDAYLPSDYISDQMQKIEMYKKFINIKTIQSAYEIEEELLDRFGELAQPAINLLAIARIKVYTYIYHIESVTQKGKEVIIKIRSDQNQLINGYKLFIIANEFKPRVKLASTNQLTILINTKGLTPEEIIALIEKFLIKYQDTTIKGEQINEKF